jgi:hypothetical protein
MYGEVKVDFRAELLGLMKCMAMTLQLGLESDEIRSAVGYDASSLGTTSERADEMAVIVEAVNAHLTLSDPLGSVELRRTILDLIPQILMHYQALRFPAILDPMAPLPPVKSGQSGHPEIVKRTGMILPVSGLLRLIGVSLLDKDSIENFKSNGLNVRVILSHAVDDPLNPYQRENAIFVLKIISYEKEITVG